MTDADKSRRFTVEATDHGKRGKPVRFGIRYRSPAKINADGSLSIGLSCIVLEAGEYLADQETVLGGIADILEEHWQ